MFVKRGISAIMYLMPSIGNGMIISLLLIKESTYQKQSSRLSITKGWTFFLIYIVSIAANSVSEWFTKKIQTTEAKHHRISQSDKKCTASSQLPNQGLKNWQESHENHISVCRIKQWTIFTQRIMYFRLLYSTFVWYKLYTQQARKCLYVGTNKLLFLL